MTYLDTLRSRIALHPEDPEPRRAFARELATRDPPRAEFIQAQVALAGRGVDPQQRRVLRERVRLLLREHDGIWAAPLRALGASEFEFVQGFVPEITLSEENFATRGEALLELEPVRRWRICTQDGRGVARAAAQPWFEAVQGIYLTGRGVQGALDALASAPHAGKLGFLTLSRVKRVDALLGSEALPGLRSLSLTSNSDLGDAVAALLPDTRLSLARLYLTGTDLSDEGVQALARAKPLGSLELLALNRNQVGDEGAQALATSKTLGGLRRLELDNNELSEEGALAFRAPKALPHLRELRLEGMGLSREALAPLFKRLGRHVKL